MAKKPKFPVRDKFPRLGLVSPKNNKRSEYVTEAQHLLHSGRFGNFHPGTIDGVFGPHTAQATKKAKFALGYPIKKVNGHFGPRLRTYLLPAWHPQHEHLPLTYKARRKRRMHKKKPGASIQALMNRAV